MSEEQIRGNYTTKNGQIKIKIVVIGAGGGGVNAINSMYCGNLDIPGVTFVVCNTDYQSLDSSPCPNKIQLGVISSAGLGAGKNLELGEAAVKENLDEVEKFLEDAHMVFIAFGAGGGTGSTAAPFIAEAARKKGILTVGVVTKPFAFEGLQTMEIAQCSIKNFKNSVDALVIVSNENIRKVYDTDISMLDGFKKVDTVLASFVASVTRIITKPGLINLDFADVRASLKDMHALAMVGIGESDNPEECEYAADLALSSPLLENCCIKDAPSVVVSIEGSPSMTLCQVHAAVSKIQGLVGKNSKNKFFFGAAVDENLKGIRVSILATLKNDFIFESLKDEEKDEEYLSIKYKDQYNNQQQELVFDSQNLLNTTFNGNEDITFDSINMGQLHEEQKGFNTQNEKKEPWWKRFVTSKEKKNDRDSQSDNEDGRNFFDKG